MPHHLDLILTLTGALTAALALGLLTQAVRLSPIVGYLLAGVLVGPFTPGFVAHAEITEQLAEIGVILLMFGVGLHFHVRELAAVKHIALPGALVQCAAATLLGLALSQFVGWNFAAGMVFGLAISIASTVVMLRMLADNNALHTPSGHIAVGWLIVEDLFTVFVLVLMPALVGRGESTDLSQLAMSVAAATLKVGGLIAFTFVVGRRAIPKLLEYIALTRSRELFTLAVLVVALGISLGAATVFGVSMALGAFLAGMVVAQSDFSARAASDAVPMRDAFAVIFFVSIGMLFNPALLMNDWALTLGSVAIVVIAKPLAAFAVVVLLKRRVKTALTIAVALAQIGEFSFILAAMGRQLGVLPENASQVLVATAIVSITLNPLLFRCVGPLERWLSAREHKADESNDLALKTNHESSRTIVVGYGPVGRTLTQLLRENQLEPVVIELNHETVAKLRAEGVTAIYGDAANSETLVQAGVEQARSLIFAAHGSPAEDVIRLAKELNPALLVLARATHLNERDQLESAGANAIVTAEAEVALAMTERVLVGLGATAEQLDRERHRVRAALRRMPRAVVET